MPIAESALNSKHAPENSAQTDTRTYAVKYLKEKYSIETTSHAATIADLVFGGQAVRS